MHCSKIVGVDGRGGRRGRRGNGGRGGRDAAGRLRGPERCAISRISGPYAADGDYRSEDAGILAEGGGCAYMEGKAFGAPRFQT